MQCIRCGNLNTPTRMVCGSCGAILPVVAVLSPQSSVDINENEDFGDLVQPEECSLVKEFTRLGQEVLNGNLDLEGFVHQVEAAVLELEDFVNRFRDAPEVLVEAGLQFPEEQDYIAFFDRALDGFHRAAEDLIEGVSQEDEELYRAALEQSRKAAVDLARGFNAGKLLLEAQ